MKLSHRRFLLSLFVATTVIVALPISARAEVAVGATLGTLGGGVEVVAGTPRIQARVALAAGTISDDVTTNDVRYDGDLDLRYLPVLVDFYPFAGSFRLSAGAVLNDTELFATALPSQLVDPGDLPPGIPPTLLDQFGRLEGTATFDSVAPYAGLGFGNPLAGGRFQFRFDLGVLFAGEPDVNLEARLMLPVGIPPEIQSLVDAFVAEEEAELREEVSDYDLYPVVQVGFSYRF